jgi:hypothetical protein
LELLALYNGECITRRRADRSEAKPGGWMRVLVCVHDDGIRFDPY